jgi:Ner family transcriptional regulator
MSEYSTPSGRFPVDWHPADIVAALHKRGVSLRQLAKKAGYRSACLGHALHLPWPKAERLIANEIGVKPHEVWPSRYRIDGSPLRERRANGQGRYVKSRAYSGTRRRRNVHRAGSF